ncbi:hypothetical protein GLYMA_07G007350v4 [Glycine max]|nr:hypothetical protein GLYMA_07G007350v4 [Glycine max]KAH1084716.1 hypothetical protein GYH30_017005 [Glycine max]
MSALLHYTTTGSIYIITAESYCANCSQTVFQPLQPITSKKSIGCYCVSFQAGKTSGTSCY